MRQARSVSVLALSAATLAFEILLVRVFAIEQFHHFATMAVGVALLGIGTAGTGFALAAPALRGDAADRWFVTAAWLTAVSLLVAPLLADLVTVDPTALAWDVRQWARVALLYLILATPFGLSALATLAALAGSKERPGTVYGANLLGAGWGTVAALASLWVLNPEPALALPGLLAALGALLAAGHSARPGRVRALALILAALAILFLVRTPWALRLLPYKALPQLLAFPDARVVAQETSPVGWVTAVEAPAFRYAPGLSLAYQGEFPRQTALLVDGELAGALSAWDGGSAELLEWQPSALPYALGGRDTVLVIGGGAHELANAVRHGASSVIVGELQPALARLSHASPLPRSEVGAGVTWVVGDPRAFVARSAGRFDLITLGPLAGGAPGPGTRALAEDYGHTVEAYQRYLERLSPGGVLALTGSMTEPPRGNLRIVLTAAEALRRSRAADIAAGLVVVRSWSTATTLIKPAGFTAAQVDTLRAWAESRWFDLDWSPGMTAPDTRFHFVDRPVLFEAARAAVESRAAAERLAEDYLFDVRPATDARPYPHHFVGPRALRRMLAGERGEWLPFAEWGYIALLATLVQSALLALVLLLLPLLLNRLRSPPRQRESRSGSLLWLSGYFGAIGLAYLAAEIAAMQQLTLLLGHPVYAVAAVLALLLLASGVGSLWSDRLRPAPWPSLVLTPALLIYAVVLLPLAERLEPASLVVRATLALLLLAPVALVMGMPFPMGLRALAPASPVRLAWAWAANGFTSVVTAPLAALVALEAGTRVVFGLAALGYLIAAGCLWLATPRSSPAR